MGAFITKLRLIYLPFLVIAVSFLIIYSLLRWIVYQLAFDINEELTNFWLPFCLPPVFLYVWLRPRIKLLILKDRRGNLPFIYFVIASLAISMPTIFAQEYLNTAAGKLTILNDINDINKTPFTKYYSLKHHYVDKRHMAFYRRTEVAGKNNESLIYHLYVVCPILNDKSQLDTVNSDLYNNPIAWLGIEYKKNLNNNITNEEKEQGYKNLWIEGYSKFETDSLDKFTYLDKLGNNDRRKGFNRAIKTASDYNGKPVIIFESKTEPFEARNGDKFAWILKSFGIGATIWFVMLLFPKIDSKQIKKLPEYSTRLQWLTFSKFITGIKLTGNTPVFIWPITLNIIIFVVMVCAGFGFVSFDGRDLFELGANYRPAVLAGQWWRLITSIFLHGGLMHLLLNMYGLFFASIFLEPIIGRVRYLVSFIFCGLCASIASIWWHPATISVGASGAIFGLYGILIALLTTDKTDKAGKKTLLLLNLIFIVANLVMGLAGGIDNAAHVGGLVSGLFLGYIFYFFIEKPKPKRKYQRKTKNKLTIEEDGQAVIEGS